MSTLGLERFALALAAGLSGALALAQPGYGEDLDPSSARLIAGTEALVAGEVNTLGLAFELEEGWHIYFDGQNDTGFAPDPGIEWPEGWELVGIEQPVPIRYIAAGDLLDHVLEGAPVLLLRVRVPEDSAGQTAQIRGRSSWLVCKEACLMDDEAVELEIPIVSSGTPLTPSDEAATLAQAEAASAGPEPEPEGPTIAPAWLDASWKGETLSLRVTDKARDGWRDGWRLEFYPAGDSVFIEDVLRTGSSRSGRLSLTTEAGSGDETPPVRGIAAVRSPEGVRHVSWVRLNRADSDP